MSSMFRGLSIFAYNRENAIKEGLIASLSENAKEIQFEFKESGKDYIELDETTSSLCTTLEAIFLHGLKDSLLWQTITVLSNDVDRRPEPSFWPPLLVFMHKQVIEQIQNLTQITTEIGCCRSWIRMSLNESLLSSYLENIRKNSSDLSPYYKKHAFLKDSDNLEMASRILSGIETVVRINLPINSSLLNSWPNNSLQLCGIWSPPLRSCPIASGIDVASSMTEAVVIPTPKPLQTNEIFSESISNSPFNQNLFPAPPVSDLTESEHLQILLQKVDEMEKIPEEIRNNDDIENIQKLSKRKSAPVGVQVEIEEPIQIKDEIIGNSVILQSGWSNLVDENATNNNFPGNNNTNVTTPIDGRVSFSRSNSMTSSLKSPVDRHSYNTLLVRHERTREQDWTDVWSKFESTLKLGGGDSSVTGSNDPGSPTTAEDGPESHDFEMIPESMSEKFSLQELQQMVEQLCKLARESGLDSQGFVCKSCAYPLGIGFAPAQVCAFSGNYFCDTCMNVAHFMIPAKIIYNWDFRKYSVSKRAATFLMEFQWQPFIDLKLLNPDIYMASEDMAALQSLRIRLNFIRAYLFTCRESIIEDLQKEVLYKDYLYEHIHQYSIADLQMIQKGTLAQLLQKTVIFGEEHILNCRLCKVKGFICEICGSPKVLYPFHLDTTYRCHLCGAVFHAHCLDDSQPCPKCERKRKREDLPLFEAVHML